MTIFSKKFRSGFTIVELLVVISVIATLSVVAYASTQVIQTNRYNTKRVADVATLSNAMEAQYMQTKMIPDPTANRQFYDKFGGYEHSASGAYGVTSLFSEDILGKWALAYHPRDPDTDAYYAFGKLLQYTPEYQVGAVLRVDGVPTAYIRGTYSRTDLNSLIRGYNTNTFAIDGGTTSLPYNPYLKEITAQIIEHSGTVSVSPTKSLTGALGVNDTINVGTGWLAVLKVSDGTELIIGSTDSETKLSLTSLELKDDTGLFTKVRGILAVGEVVAKAPKLRNIDGKRSELEIQTNNAVAAVRGTIFAAKVSQVGSPTSSFTLIAGSLQMAETTADSTMTVTGSGVVNDIITVLEGEDPVTVDVVSRVATSTAITNSNDPVLVSIQDRLDVASPIESTLVEPSKISFDTVQTAGSNGVIKGSVIMENIPGAEIIRVNGISTPVNPDGQQTVVPFDISQGGSYSFEYCKNVANETRCSKPYIINIPNPQVGIAPLESLAPIIENKIAQLAVSDTTVDSYEISVPQTVTGSTTWSNGNGTIPPVAPTSYCSGLGEVADGMHMIGCADYTKGSVNMILMPKLECLLFNKNSQGTNTVLSDGWLNIPNQSSSYLKYEYLGWYSTCRPNTNYAMDFGLKGSDLMRSSGKHYIVSWWDNLSVYLDQNSINVYSNLYFISKNDISFSASDERTISTPISGIDPDKKYILRVKLNSTKWVSIQIKENTPGVWGFATILSGITKSYILPINTAYIGSASASASSTQWKWNGNMQFFGVWEYRP